MWTWRPPHWSYMPATTTRPERAARTGSPVSPSMSMPLWKPYFVSDCPKYWVIGPISGQSQPEFLGADLVGAVLVELEPVPRGFGAMAKVTEARVDRAVPSVDRASIVTASLTRAPKANPLAGIRTSTVSPSAQTYVPVIILLPTDAVNARSVEAWSIGSVK